MNTLNQLNWEWGPVLFLKTVTEYCHRCKNQTVLFQLNHELYHEKGSRVHYLTVKSGLKTQIEEEFNKNIYQEIAVAYSSLNLSKLWSVKIRVNTFVSPLFSPKVFWYNTFLGVKCFFWNLSFWYVTYLRYFVHLGTCLMHLRNTLQGFLLTIHGCSK